MIFFVVSYSQCNVLTGHHCVLQIVWSVISWYLSYHLSFQKNMGVLNFFLCVYMVQREIWKVETLIINSIVARPIGQCVLLVIKYVETFKSDVIVFSVLNVIMRRHTDRYFPVSESLSWYWRHHSLRSKEKRQTYHNYFIYTTCQRLTIALCSCTCLLQINMS